MKVGVLAYTAHALGTGWVRLLVRHPAPWPWASRPTSEPFDVLQPRVPLLVELHDPGWLTPRPMRRWYAFWASWLTPHSSPRPSPTQATISVTAQETVWVMAVVLSV